MRGRRPLGAPQRPLLDAHGRPFAFRAATPAQGNRRRQRPASLRARRSAKSHKRPSAHARRRASTARAPGVLVGIHAGCLPGGMCAPRPGCVAKVWGGELGRMWMRGSQPAAPAGRKRLCLTRAGVTQDVLRLFLRRLSHFPAPLPDMSPTRASRVHNSWAGAFAPQPSPRSALAAPACPRDARRPRRG